MLRATAKPKNFKCEECGRETYERYNECKGCNESGTIKPISGSKEESELRKELHDTIDVMTYNQLRALHKLIF